MGGGPLVGLRVPSCARRKWLDFFYRTYEVSYFLYLNLPSSSQRKTQPQIKMHNFKYHHDNHHQQVETNLLTNRCSDKTNRCDRHNIEGKEQTESAVSVTPSSITHGVFVCQSNRGAFSEVYMVKEKKTGKMFAMKCVKKKQKIDLNLENEITVLRRYILFSQYSVWDTITMSSFLFFLLLRTC